LVARREILKALERPNFSGSKEKQSIKLRNLITGTKLTYLSRNTVSLFRDLSDTDETRVKFMLCPPSLRFIQRGNIGDPTLYTEATTKRNPF
ncbi:uncharacterized protein N7500_009410, partial [Penicillium coprophilum]|uniref:uncharacterized protein n=1 Tax=Penicillium coprophilum TaxID=36646 RepID=UPI0023893110